jgi:zinc protease
MRSLRKHAIAAATVVLALAAPTFAQVKDYREIKAPALHPVTTPQPKRIVLANGMVIFLQEDHELPLIRGSVQIHGGERNAPADKAGIASILGQSWRTGGTESKTGDQIDEMLESRAARVETGADADSMTVRFDTLKGDFNTVFPIFVELLQKPAFREEKINLAKTQARSAISRRNDEPGDIIAREANKLGYGADSPYVRQPEYATIESITRDDLLAFHHQFVYPNNIILGVVGDFDSAQMEKTLRSTFGSWSKGPQASVPALAGAPAKGGVYFIPKDDVTQANIAVVHSGAPQRNDPDYPAIVVMNEILSGGFSGRLMNHIRSKMGLAYGVSGGLVSNYDHPGVFRVRMGTKSETTLQSVGALRTEVADLLSQPFTDEELTHAKDSILNAYVFTADSKNKVLNQRMTLEFYGYPADYYQKYPGNIQKVTSADVARVAKKYVRPDQLSVLVVGREKDFEKPLSSLGSVTPIDITIPEPGAKPSASGTASPSAAPAAPAGSNADGVALVHKVQAFAGGKQKIDSIQAVHTVSAQNMTTPQGPMDMDIDSTTSFPDRVRRVMKTPMGEMTMVVTPDAGFVAGPMGNQDLPSSQRDSMRNDMKADYIMVLKNVDNPKYTFAVTGSEKVGTTDAKVLEINADGSTMKWWVDPATGKVLRRSSRGRQGEQIAEITEYKSFDGVNFPTAYSVMVNGEKTASGQVKSIEINPTVDEKLFAKP